MSRVTWEPVAKLARLTPWRTRYRLTNRVQVSRLPSIAVAGRLDLDHIRDRLNRDSPPKGRVFPVAGSNLAKLSLI